MCFCRGRSRRQLYRSTEASGWKKEQSPMAPHQVSMPAWQEKHLRAATRAAGVALWSWNVDTDAITMDEAAYDLWGVAKEQPKITFEILPKISIQPILRGSDRRLRLRAQ